MCIIFNVFRRPTAKHVMEQIASVSTVKDDAYGQVNLVDLIHKVDKGEPKVVYYDTAAGSPTGGDQSMKRRIESFQVKVTL